MSRQATLDDRYGTRGRKRVDRIAGISLAAVLVLGGIAFLAFGGLPSGDATVEVRDISHTIIDDQHVSVTVEVTAAAGAEVACALEARNPRHAVVGWRIIELPTSEEHTRVITEELRTTNEATSVTGYHCWVKESA